MPSRDLHALTARERQVLDFIRLGLTNEEIAQRLGITFDGAKYHVSQILAKLGVATRDEAAAIVIEVRRRWWAAWPLWAKIASTATMGAATAGIAVLIWGAVRTGGPHEESAVAAPTPVSWVDSKPVPQPTPAPAPFPTPDPSLLAVRACHADDLVAAPAETRFQGGYDFVGFVFANVSDERCRLQGTPSSVALMDADQQVLSLEWRSDACAPGLCPPNVPILQPRGSLPVSSHEPASPSRATIVFRYQGGPFPPCPTSVSGVLFALPEDGGQVVIRDDSLNGCVGPWVGEFHSEVGPTPPPAPAPTPAPLLTAELEVPTSVPAGRRLEFIVKLTNTSGNTFAFGSICPNYSLFLGAKDVVDEHSLNCRAITSIADKQSATFAMELLIPSSLPPGRYLLGWSLNGGTYWVDAGTGTEPHSIDVSCAIESDSCIETSTCCPSPARSRW